MLLLSATNVLGLSPPSSAFDFVIVGGGTAGCVLANRLSADPSTRVLVLEPGPSPRGSLKIAAPVALTKLFHSSWDWSFASSPTTATAGRKVHLARGRALGGSSALNALLYHRGAAEDFDAWALPGWGSEEMLESFRAVEAQTRPDLKSSAYHGIDGAVGVEDVRPRGAPTLERPAYRDLHEVTWPHVPAAQARYTNPLSSSFMEAALQAGFSENTDFNDWSRPQEGVGRFQLQTRRGRRAHAAATHLRPARHRANLHVRSGATATRVLLDERCAATGVAYKDENGEEQVATVEPASGEVLLCAGAVNTPQLLMLSGVGPRAELQRHGLSVAVELPGVGHNLADHPAVVTGFTINEPLSITDQMFVGKGILSPARVAQWLARGSGPLATSGCDFGGL